MIGIKVEKQKQLSDTITTIPCPKKITIPYSKDAKIKVKNKDFVKTGTILGYDKKQAIISSATGIITKISPKIEIETKEEKKVKIKHTNFIEALQNAGIYGLSGSFKPTYLKYQYDASTLIVNMMECEPYVMADYAVSINYIKEIREILVYLLENQSYNEVIIAYPNNQRKLKEVLTTTFKEDDGIRLISLPNLYPLGWEKMLVRATVHKDYQDKPIEVGCIVSNIQTIYAMYKAYFLNIPLYERVITVITKDYKQNVLVRNGMKVKEVLKYLKIPYENKKIILGGLMMGKLATPNTIISLKNNSIFCIEDETLKESYCIRCGKCTNTCPVKLQPVLIKEQFNMESLKRLHPEKCIECSICSYICPARIPLKNIVLAAKEKVRK